MRPNIGVNEFFVIISYKSTETVNCITIETIDGSLEQSGEEYKKHALVENFLKDIFTKQWKCEEDNHFYHIAQAVARYYFAFGKDKSGMQFNDAFLYPSVKTRVFNNIAFNVEAAQGKLSLCGAAIAKLDNSSSFKVLAYMTRSVLGTLRHQPSEKLSSIILPNYKIRFKDCP